MWRPRVRQTDGKKEIFCDWRRKYVCLTPEECVRQQFLHMLVEHYGYPMSRVAVEQAVHVADTDKRCDAVVYDESLHPLCIIEFKAESVPLTQNVFDQIAIYNRALKVKYLIISSGKVSYACRVESDKLTFLENIPDYTQLCRNR